MIDLTHDSRVRGLIETLEKNRDAVQSELDKVAALNITDDPYMATYHLQASRPVEVTRHPAMLRGKLAVLNKAIEGLTHATKPADVISVYRDVAITNIMKAEYFSTYGRVDVAMRLRNQLDELMTSLGVDPAPPTQTASQRKKID